MQYNISTIEELKTFCKQLRNFDKIKVYFSKLIKINNFFKEEKLDSAVVGLSGGIDSSLVYKLLIDASKFPTSPIKRVEGVFMPIDALGITGQHKAEIYVHELINSIEGTTFIKKDLSKVAKEYYNVLGTNDPWTCGQIASIVRTPALYGIAAKLQHEGYKSIVVGTTNRDEGAYIGFFGKASDGMVDLQPIADLHKSEVYDLAELCGIPECIINRPPEGDVWDGRIDEEMFGAPYWFLEMYQILIENDARYLVGMCANIEIQHMKNKHKYKVGSPSRYIDVMKRELL
jgi:NAD+ synthetase